MKKTIVILVLISVLVSGVSVAYATPVFDAANYAINIIRNFLMESEHVTDMLESAKRLLELKNLVTEFQFFNFQLIEQGFSEIRGMIDFVRSFGQDSGETVLRIGDELTGGFFSSLLQNPFYRGSPDQVARLDAWASRTESGTSLPYYLTLIPDPLSPEREFITYEQAQIARSFDQAELLREYAQGLAREGKALMEEAQTTNLLGAARLQAASTGKLYEILGVMLATQGRLSELNAIQLEQVSRGEKLDELSREKMLEDLAGFIGSAARAGGELW